MTIHLASCSISLIFEQMEHMIYVGGQNMPNITILVLWGGQDLEFSRNLPPPQSNHWQRPELAGPI